MTCAERQDFAEAEQAMAAEEAAWQEKLRRLGFPKPCRCLNCDAPHTATEPSDRLCRSCRGSNSNVYDDPGAGTPKWFTADDS